MDQSNVAVHYSLRQVVRHIGNDLK